MSTSRGASPNHGRDLPPHFNSRQVIGRTGRLRAHSAPVPAVGPPARCSKYSTGVLATCRRRSHRFEMKRVSFEPTPFTATGTTRSLLVYLGVFVQLVVRELLVPERGGLVTLRAHRSALTQRADIVVRRAPLKACRHAPTPRGRSVSVSSRRTQLGGTCNQGYPLAAFAPLGACARVEHSRFLAQGEVVRDAEGCADPRLPRDHQAR